MDTRTTVVIAVLVLVACAGDASGDGRERPGDDADASAGEGRGQAGAGDAKPAPDAVPGPTPGSWRYPTAAWRCQCTKFTTPEDAQAWRSGSLDPNLITGTTRSRQRVCADSLEGVLTAAEAACGGTPGTCVCDGCCPQPDVPFEQALELTTCLADEPGECDGRLCPDSPPACKPL